MTTKIEVLESHLRSLERRQDRNDALVHQLIVIGQKMCIIVRSRKNDKNIAWFYTALKEAIEGYTEKPIASSELDSKATIDELYDSIKESVHSRTNEDTPKTL